MSLKDRTNEFFSAVSTLEAREKRRDPSFGSSTASVSSGIPPNTYSSLPSSFQYLHASSSSWNKNVERGASAPPFLPLTSTPSLLSPPTKILPPSHPPDADENERSSLLSSVHPQSPPSLSSFSSSWMSASSHPPSSSPSHSLKTKSEFTRTASKIAHGIQATALKLENLGKLARRRTLFDDRPMEINELTAMIKQDITSLNDQIKTLQIYSKSTSQQRKRNKQEEEHSENVVFGLQSSLAKTSQSFAEVLEKRTENLKAQKERRDQYLSSTPVPALVLPPPSQSSLYTLEPTQASPSNQNTHVAISMLMQPQDLINAQYLEQRHTAVETIERTVAELGQIFQQLGELVSQQREHVLRIDDNVSDIETNIDLARRELFKYWDSVSSNRALLVKVFAVVLVFFILFTVFL